MITSQLQPTAHFRRRMSQRGIKQAYVDLTLEYGKEMGDKLILQKDPCPSGARSTGAQTDSQSRWLRHRQE